MDRSLLFSLLFGLLSAQVAVAQVPYRINTNGPAFTDSATGNQWQADAFFTVPGLTYSNGVTVDTTGDGATEELLYQTERYKDDMKYEIPGESH